MAPYGKKVYTDQLNGVQSENVRTRVFPIARNTDIDIGVSFVIQFRSKIVFRVTNTIESNIIKNATF